MNVVISGASGLVGRALVPRLEEAGHNVVRLVRGEESSPGTSKWSPADGVLDASVIEEADAVVNLSGESIAGGLWTTSRKERIVSSRIKTTTLLAETMAGSSSKPGVFVCASAVGFYGDRPGEELTERAEAGKGFLADTCVEWEGATTAARNAGVRVVLMRTGIVLSNEGGFLEKVVLPFKAGLGGRVGSGKQMMSWISLRDLVRAFVLALERDSIAGPVNATAPTAVSNSEFTETLADVLSRPALIPVPEFVLKMTLGEMAEELMLASQNVIPDVLVRSGFTHSDPELAGTLKRLLG